MAGKSLAFIGAYMRANLAMVLEYRVSLVSMVAGMLINNALWVFFWALYFSRFPVVRGWTLDDVVMLWAVGHHQLRAGGGADGQCSAHPADDRRGAA